MSAPNTTDPEDLPPLGTSHRPPSHSRRFSLATGPRAALRERLLLAISEAHSGAREEGERIVDAVMREIMSNG